MKRARVTYAALLLVGFAASNAAQQAAGQTGPGWISLFDGKTVGDEWDRVGEPQSARRQHHRVRKLRAPDRGKMAASP
jgi:hypothetical protein